MIKISSLKPGQVVWDAHTYRMGHTTMRTMGVWHVKIVEVDPDGRWVLASWNGNPAQKFYGRRGSLSWRKKRPKLVSNGLTSRLQTRDEIKAESQSGS